MKRCCFLLIITMLLVIFASLSPCGQDIVLAANAGEVPDIVTGEIQPEDKELQSKLSGLDFASVEKYLEQINNDLSKTMPELNLKDLLWKLAHGELGISVTAVISGLLRFLFREMIANSRLLGQLLVLSVLCAILQNVQSAFEKGTVGKVAWSVCFMVLLTLALGSFTMAVQTGREAIEDMVSFMHSMIPVLITLLTAMGNVTTAALFHPLTLTVLSTISTLIKNIVFPLIFFAVVLGLANNVTSRVEVSKLAGLLKQWSIGLLGMFFTIFLGFMAIQGLAGGVADGVALRTAKFSIGAFVPVVGKLFSDTLEAVVGTSLLLKNAVGLVGILAVFFICAMPVLKILSLMLVYKIAGAIIQPVGDKLIADSLTTMGNALTLVFISVTAVGIMFFFVIAIMVGVGDFSLMLR